MAGDRRSATSTLTARVESAVGDELREAALARWEHSPDVFVWRSRRCAEAVLYALLHRAHVDVDALAKQRKGLDQLLEHKQIEGVLSRETRAQLASLRDFGNIAAHYQLTGGVSGDSAEGVARFLASLLREFYSVDGGAVAESQATHIAALTDRARRIPTPHELALEQEQQRARELTHRLSEAQRADASAREVSGHRPAGYWIPAVAAAVTVAVMAFLVGRSTSEPSALERTHPTLTSAEPPATPVAPTSTVESPSPVAPSPTVEPQPSPVAPSPPSAPVAEHPSPAAPPLQCPQGMVRVPAGAGHEEFCVDHTMVTEGEYRRCVTRGGCQRPPIVGTGCNWASGTAADGLAANCVSWQFAREYCRSQRVGGDLPTRHEWNAAAPLAARLAVRNDTNEWSADDESADRHHIRGARGARGFAWDVDTGPEGRRSTSFRCVVRATRGE